ncbi:MAG: hypothetical protein QOC83_7294, partial [Pseudonocardiales bacterium]|nr:hypothetical protein [Pseudonocardiales bacterium]
IAARALAPSVALAPPPAAVRVRVRSPAPPAQKLFRTMLVVAPPRTLD